MARREGWEGRAPSARGPRVWSRPLGGPMGSVSEAGCNLAGMTHHLHALNGAYSNRLDSYSQQCRALCPARRPTTQAPALLEWSSSKSECPWSLLPCMSMLTGCVCALCCRTQSAMLSSSTSTNRLLLRGGQMEVVHPEQAAWRAASRRIGCRSGMQRRAAPQLLLAGWTAAEWCSLKQGPLPRPRTHGPALDATSVRSAGLGAPRETPPPWVAPACRAHLSGLCS